MKAFTIFFIAAILAALLLPAGSAAALPGETTIHVNTYIDEYDLSPNSTCSLREAITAAVLNDAFGGCTGGVSGENTTIHLQAYTYDLTRAGIDDTNANGDLDVMDSLDGAEAITIDGIADYNTIIDGNSLDRIFDLNAYANVHLVDLSVTYGQSQVTDSRSGWGGGIYNEGYLSLQNVTVSRNISGRDDVSARGGGIYNAGDLYIYDSKVQFNHTLSGISGDSSEGGGGIYNDNNLTIVRSDIYSNWTGDGGTTGVSSASGGDGGGIYNTGDLEIIDTLVGWNRTGRSSAQGHGGYGGGIFNAGVAEIYSSNFYANSTGEGTLLAGGNGGAISNNGTLYIQNSTISTNGTGRGATGLNTGQGGDGGGLYSTGTVQVYLTTIADNFTGIGTPNGNGGGVYITTGATKLMEGTIVANNSSSNTSPDCYAFLDNPRYNLIENATNCAFQGTPVGNITGQDPRLSDLVTFDNYSDGYLLTRGSPAIDKVLACSITTDQRGVLRPIDGDQNGSTVCDIGSIEMGMPFFLPMLRVPW
jgi:CSLREA domain-containing protein